MNKRVSFSPRLGAAPNMLVGFFWLLVFFAVVPSSSSSSDTPPTAQRTNNKILCQYDQDCQAQIGPASTCVVDESDGFSYCHENRLRYGCLNALFPDRFGPRVCNSDDDVFNSKKNTKNRNKGASSSSTLSCRRPDIDYGEVRIYASNWESGLFVSWILQIILSELLGVPTTVETGLPDHVASLYQPDDDLDYGNSLHIESLTAATQQGNCAPNRRFVRKNNNNGNDGNDAGAIDQAGDLVYQPCAHIVPEYWESTSVRTTDNVYNGIVEPPQSLGALGMEGWFVTKFTLDENPSLATYIGLQERADDDNHDRRKLLADTFLRPTTWGDYCDQVSLTACQQPDGVALRAPLDPTEANQMFVDGGVYTGHFRKTEENDCLKYPHDCTGHISEYPCGWSSFTESQAYHLNIPLRSSGPEPGARGYTYDQLTGILKAANATKSNLMIYWWTPEPLYQSFQGTDSELIRVTLPAPTQECQRARTSTLDRCSENWSERIGLDPAGACDDSAKPLEKIISTGLYDMVFDPSIPDAIRSPAYEVLRAFKLSELQMAEMFDYWKREKSDLRGAICSWAGDNQDYLESFVPRTYPRKSKDARNNYSAGSLVSVVVGGLATAMVLHTLMVVYRNREQREIKLAQYEFLVILLVGLFCIALGAIVTGLPPSNASCILGTWLVNLGYTLEIVPLVVKVGAINRLSMAARRLRRVTLKRRTLLGTVALISSIIAVFLAVWTALDPPHRSPEYSFEDAVLDDGKYVVETTYHCTSDSEVYSFAAISWFLLLLFWAAVLAFQMRNLQKEINESSILAIMIYSHCMFVLLRLGTTILQGQVPGWLLGRLQSFIYSADTIVTLIIYFYSNLFASLLDKRQNGSMEFDEEVPANRSSINFSTRNPLSNNPRRGRVNHDSFFNATLASVGPHMVSIKEEGESESFSWSDPSEKREGGTDAVEMPITSSPRTCYASGPTHGICTRCGSACLACKTHETKPLIQQQNEFMEEASHGRDTGEQGDQGAPAYLNNKDDELAALEGNLTERLSKGGHRKPDVNFEE